MLSGEMDAGAIIGGLWACYVLRRRGKRWSGAALPLRACGGLL